MARQKFFLTRAHEIRIAYLVGSGCTLAEILEDLEINDQMLIRNFLEQVSLELQSGAGGKRTVPVQINNDAAKIFTRAAVKRDIVGADKLRKIVQRSVEALAADIVKLDRNLGDGIKTDG